MKHKILFYVIIIVNGLILSCSLSKTGSDLVQPEKWWQVHPRPVYASLEKVGTFQEWFDVYKLAEGTYAIYEPNQFEEAICYLVLGSEKCVVIDAGNGIGDLKELISNFTDLPVTLILTHEHYDHIGSAHQFSEIAVFNNKTCLEVIKRGRSNPSLQKYIAKDYLWKPLPKKFDPKSWQIPPLSPTMLLSEGDIIDLGDRKLEVIYTPGHSPGSICLLDKKQKILFTGDHFFPGPLYAHTPDVNIDNYIASNKKLCKRIREFDFLCSGHNDPWVKSEVLLRVGEAFDTIFKGDAKYSENEGLRRYYFKRFDVLILSDTVKLKQKK
ncbi:MBL fold metallo-hydrolase [candidate division KSB1 bacterium]